jgi:hypothetical protein
MDATTVWTSLSLGVVSPLISRPLLFVGLQPGLAIQCWRFDGISDQAFNELPNRYVWLRNPYLRAVSAYRFYHTPGGGPHDACRDDFEGWVKRVCSDENLGDQHVQLQTVMLGDVDCAELIKWDFKRLCEVLNVPEIPLYHCSDKSIPVEWTPEALGVFKERYKEDLALWT